MAIEIHIAYFLAGFLFFGVSAVYYFTRYTAYLFKNDRKLYNQVTKSDPIESILITFFGHPKEDDNAKRISKRYRLFLFALLIWFFSFTLSDRFGLIDMIGS